MSNATDLLDRIETALALRAVLRAAEDEGLPPRQLGAIDTDLDEATRALDRTLRDIVEDFGNEFFMRDDTHDY